MTRPVSVITTVFNEASTIDTFIAGLDAQSRTPDEVIVVDAGSSDGTIDHLQEAARTRRWLRVVVEPGNRSHGRNVAIEAASHEVIAATDAGCSLDRQWLDLLTRPFEENADWVAGFYFVDAASVVDRCAGLTIVYVIEEVDPDSFLPSARSMAFTKDAWAAVDGFPEHVDFGEDTLFDMSLMERGYRPSFVGDAVVGWHPPRGLRGLIRTTFRWGRGDGAAGLRGPYYKRTARAYVGLGVLALAVGAWRPIMLPVVGALTVPAIWKSIRHKLGHESHPAKYVLLPTARIAATTANLTGYVVGRSFGEPTSR